MVLAYFMRKGYEEDFEMLLRSQEAQAEIRQDADGIHATGAGGTGAGEGGTEAGNGNGRNASWSGSSTSKNARNGNGSM